ncbi:MAG TPA: penicillin-binding transpeptidase domain-containing protein, partial [Acidimicrobiia bacterium]
FPPGSTFKVLTAAAALGAGAAQPDTQFPEVKSYAIPGTNSILSNFEVNGEPESCGGSLVESLVISCNTTFAKLGYDLHDQFPPAMSACGINNTPPIDLDPGAEASAGPLAGADRPRFALAGIGQGDVFVTPLQMALVAAGIANGGTEMKPHVVSEIQDADGATLATISPEPWKTCMSASTAAALKTMMVQVVERGTGTLAQIPGVAVAGKTGTAQTQPGKPPHAWFIAFAPADQPRYAVAVLVEAGGTLNENATGGQVAAPIAKQMLQTLLGLPH